MTLHLASGTLQIAGGHGLTKGYVIPVIGGTSGYAGARGTGVAAGQHESEWLTILLALAGRPLCARSRLLVFVRSVLRGDQPPASAPPPPRRVTQPA